MFVSTATNTLDTKGRVSVPAGFRAQVDDEAIFVWPSFDGPFLEGGGQALLNTYSQLIESMDPYDDVRIAFEHTIFGSSKSLSFDATGRVSLPKDLCVHAQLSSSATFVGLGSRFQIWEPKAYELRAQALRDMAKSSRHLMRPKVHMSGEGEA